MAWRRCVLPIPGEPCRKSGLYEWPGSSATASAAACAKRLPAPITNCSKVYFGFSRSPCRPCASVRRRAGSGRAGRLVPGGRLPVVADHLDQRVLVEADGRGAAQQREVALGDRGADVLGRAHVDRVARGSAASSSGSSQMWNLKSGVSRRSSPRMASQISSGCAGTGGRDPPRGPTRSVFAEEGPSGTKLSPAALGRASVHRQKSSAAAYPGGSASQNAGKASRRRSCTLARGT